YPGAEIGPMVSQFQLRDFVFNGIPIDGRAEFLLPVNGGDGIDFLTTFDEWLASQRGIAAPQGTEQREDPMLHYPRSARDLGRVAGQDNIIGAYFRANLMMGGFEEDDANPYKTAQRQGGAATLGGIERPGVLLNAFKGERHAWYQKWFVHRYLRPEAFGGRVHLTKIGARNYPIDPQLLNSPVMDLIFERNRLVNQRRGISNEGSFLLPQHGVNGGPSHPSATAGHAITAGASCTILKAWFKEDAPFPPPHWAPTRDGGRVDITGQFPLTVGGELNKLAHNLSAGRDMSGVHWRVADNLSGNAQGEEVAIRLTREAKATYPEKDKFGGFSLTRFNGQTIPHIA
ncbi:MAG: phosphoesterase, partial [Gammaproteobacteria bacterium]